MMYSMVYSMVYRSLLRRRGVRVPRLPLAATGLCRLPTVGSYEILCLCRRKVLRGGSIESRAAGGAALRGGGTNRTRAGYSVRLMRWLMTRTAGVPGKHAIR